jgi:hypothetical protein
MGLEHEMSVYQTHLAEWLPEEGNYIVIKGDDIIHTHSADYSNALKVGFERFGPVSFLVKKISRYEPVHYFSRDLRLCPK